jgi:pimeloyl-ACP methyl ester carboxylesterase
MEIILIAGLWLDGSVWAPVAAELERLGHHAVPVTLPGQGTGPADATLDDQVAAVLAAVDAAPSHAQVRGGADTASARPWVVGHSAGSALAWIAADARPDRVAGVVMVGGFPAADGDPYAPNFPLVDGAMPFPGWDPFEGPDSVDLDEPARARLAAAAIPVPEGVARAVVRLTDERRYDMPVVLVCPEFTPAQAQEWIDEGELPELARAKHVTMVDIDSGHWPMLTRPIELAQLLAAAIREPSSS